MRERDKGTSFISVSVNCEKSKNNAIHVTKNWVKMKLMPLYIKSESSISELYTNYVKINDRKSKDGYFELIFS